MSGVPSFCVDGSMGVYVSLTDISQNKALYTLKEKSG